MAYQTNETSIDSGKPLELYRFKFGVATSDPGYAVYRYASGDQEVTANTNNGAAETYPQLQITRTEPEQSRELNRTKITVTMPRDAVFAQQFISSVPSLRCYLVIFRLHEQDGVNGFVKYWSGIVKSVSFEGPTALVECEPTLVTMKRNGLRRNFGSSCQHALYDGGCGVNRATFKTDITVTAVNGEVITATGTEISSKPADWFVSGYAERTTGEKRFIIAQSGNTVTILTPFNNLQIGNVVSLFAGCKRDIATCHSKFNNKDNAFLFPYNPKKNPFTSGLK